MPTLIIVGLMSCPILDANSGQKVTKLLYSSPIRPHLGLPVRIYRLWVVDDCNRHIHRAPDGCGSGRGADMGCAAVEVAVQRNLDQVWINGFRPFISCRGECGLPAPSAARHFWDFSVGALFPGGRIFFTPAALAHEFSRKISKRIDVLKCYDELFMVLAAKPCRLRFCFGLRVRSSTSG